MSWDILDRMERAVAKVRERLLRATAALNQAGVAYAVVGGHAVASWVATVDEGAVRNTPDVDLLVRRGDLSAITAALEKTGFVRDDLRGIQFRDGADGKPREAIHLLFTDEQVRPDHVRPAPEIRTVEDAACFQVIVLESLVEMHLVSNRNSDSLYLRDLIAVGLLDRSWLPRLPPQLAERLQHILDTPDG
jgi:hypothetical protein